MSGFRGLDAGGDGGECVWSGLRIVMHAKPVLVQAGILDAVKRFLGMRPAHTPAPP